VKEMIVDRVYRTGTAESRTRSLVVVTGKGSDKVERQLSTPIEKIEWMPEFRIAGTSRAPIEQYGFKVGAKTVMRFADATALVLKRHHVRISGKVKQAYVRKAFRIIDGREDLRLAEVPTER